MHYHVTYVYQLCVVVVGVLLLVPMFAHAQFGYGGESELETVCRPTSSRFVPFVQVNVPEHVAERMLDRGGVLPDIDGECPQGISVREFIEERRERILDRLADRLSNIFNRLSRL